MQKATFKQQQSNIKKKNTRQIDEKSQKKSFGSEVAKMSKNSNEQIQFFIKTIQFFNEKGEKKNEPILVEQIFGDFNEFRIYDTSFLHYGDKVYYFKRKFIEDKEGENAENSMGGSFNDNNIYSTL